ncbi:hypothetical protein ABZ784_03365 [Streptomyces tendae]|uniref:hypothetical protein n=1 Tax=Streptomyces tendae TaxID=1932 RepID=UPI0033D16459
MVANRSNAYDARAVYMSSSYARAFGAGRAYIDALTEHQEAALAGDLDAVRVIREARALRAIVAPQLEQMECATPEQRARLNRRVIA